MPEIYQINPSRVFNCGDHRGMKLITRLCVGQSHLRELKIQA